ncbi:hypothetical protein [Bacillus sp. SH8-8]|uniref:hypothetical protein n=1 Tax=Bacillus sp. SH8-8 TaxID=2217830 RepID=UPI0034D750D7
MLDYQSHLAGLNVTINNLKNLIQSGSNNTPELEQVDKIINENFSYAFLGSIVDRLLEHDGASDIEVERLTKASDIWKMVKGYIIEVEKLRNTFESLVENPDQPGIMNKYNDLYNKLKNDLTSQYNMLVAKLQAFKDEISDLKHVTQHGQATDTPVINWTWRDIILSRRTGKFASNVLEVAKQNGDSKAISFAYGVLSSYASNVAGSAYINQTVGGPRRSHPHRDRLASYTMGAWFKENRSDLTTSINDIIAKLSFGSPNAPNLPLEINDLLMESLYRTYGNIKDFPDLNQSYQKLIKHLNLLSSFTPIPLPKPINDNTWQTMVGTLDPKDLNDNPNSGYNPSPSSSNWVDDVPWWAWVLFGVCIALVAACYFIGICAPAEKDPFRGPFQNTDETKQFLTSDNALKGVKVLFDLHCQLYETANISLKTLKLIGMIYPDSSDLVEPQFAQFTTIPRTEEQNFPKRQISNKDYYIAFPNSADENPNADISIYAAAANPNVFLEGSTSSVNEYGLSLWVAATLGQPSELNRINYNLDADRGYKHECWQVDSGSILDNPVLVKILGYDSM